MTTEKIIHIALEDSAKANRSVHVVNEYTLAVEDLLQENYFSLKAAPGGPYGVFMKIQDGKLALEITPHGKAPVRVVLPVSPFRTLMKDYFLICESYYKALKQMLSSQVQTIDMARRSLHNEGSEKLMELLSHAVETDLETARRLFTLVCVLHIRLGSMVGE